MIALGWLSYVGTTRKPLVVWADFSRTAAIEASIRVAPFPARVAIPLSA